MKKILFVLCLFFAIPAFAALTPAQMQALKDNILADPVMSVKPANSDGSWDIAVLYNQTVAPSFYVWRTDVPVEEIVKNGFDWAQVDNLTVGKARIWDWLTKVGYINASKINVRAGIDECWKGTAALVSVRDVIYTHLYRPATRIEKLFSTGTGTIASPAVMNFEGVISYIDVDQARNLQ